ncbi:alpha-1,4-glucan:maltose-1-phosphate maltosyltransferase 1 [Streptomyces daqingensis]|uniref:Alpha-1,4-glucan:maltose-1-phosphate maltosyltransferase n=1 Tax=Streptomyces daqingensis TaxID=1472640 RepID=A0ABQ2MV89_9ACTN|nr:maltotransferase domain-containing protein [Streptomyces daqingensis]GGO58064.1 alpha-1,4-glucan:maltose-1-phosphate maltosyltransferase 1 [Streptomyces daqingensis]
MIGRIPVLDVRPLVDCGRHPAKAVPGESFLVSATVFREGPGVIGANVVLRDSTGRCGPWTPMRELEPGTDRWGAEITPDREGRWTYAVEAWADPIATWRQLARVKVPAGTDAEETLEEGALLHERAAPQVPRSAGRDTLLAAAEALRDANRPVASRLSAALTPQVQAVLDRFPLRELVTATRPMALQVERERARFASWYGLFPRSEGAVLPEAEDEPPVSGTFRTAARRLDAVAEMGFDVVCLPPVHPVGETSRKGPGNAMSAGPHGVGSPWAVGSSAGGHDALHPDLGTEEDFAYFVERARSLGMEVALDFALQCSPDHPWIKEHPEWFAHGPDGAAVHAGDPPPAHQDVHQLSFDQGPDAYGALVRETVRLLRLWMARGVRVFRVDDAHAKPVAFWEKVLGDINRSDPDVVFLAGAFTRPAVMRTLAKAGFQQSCTPFPWRNKKQELTDHLTELAGETANYLRPSFFVNTPDVLSTYLQEGGRAAFQTRAVLAATLSPSWGLYAGYELCEAAPSRPGSEEYLHAEKYELRPRDWGSAEAAGESIAPLIGRLNRLRRRHPALQELRSLRFHHCDSPDVIAFSKHCDAPRADTVLVVVNLDPHNTRETTLTLEEDALSAFGLGAAQAAGAETFPVRDELTGATLQWGRENHLRLEVGGGSPAARIVTLLP